MIVKIHKTRDRRKIIAVCDEDLIGKKFSEGEKELDLDSDFYKGKEMGEAELEEESKNFFMINIAGKKSIDFFLKKKLISEEGIIYVEKIPYAQCITM